MRAVNVECGNVSVVGTITEAACLTDIMRALLIFLLVLLAVSCYSSPMPDRSSVEIYRARRTQQFVKGQKGTRAPSPLNLRKGEYICGNKICSLRPGEIPANCGGVCQYKL